MRSVTNSSRDSYFLLPPVLVLRNASVLPYAVIAPVRLWNAGESLAVIRLVIWVSADNSSIRSIASFARLKVNFFIIRRASYQDAHSAPSSHHKGALSAVEYTYFFVVAARSLQRVWGEGETNVYYAPTFRWVIIIFSTNTEHPESPALFIL